MSRGRLMTTGALESFDLVTLISLLEERFAVEITSSVITPLNFDSVESMAALIEKVRKVEDGQSANDAEAPHANLAE